MVDGLRDGAGLGERRRLAPKPKLAATAGPATAMAVTATLAWLLLKGVSDVKASAAPAKDTCDIDRRGGRVETGIQGATEIGAGHGVGIVATVKFVTGPPSTETVILVSDVAAI